MTLRLTWAYFSHYFQRKGSILATYGILAGKTLYRVNQECVFFFAVPSEGTLQFNCLKRQVRQSQLPIKHEIFNKRYKRYEKFLRKIVSRNWTNVLKLFLQKLHETCMNSFENVYKSFFSYTFLKNIIIKIIWK